jgi:hypothetical protein
VSCNTPELQIPGIPAGDTFQGGKFRFKQTDDSYASFTGATLEIEIREWSECGAIRLTLSIGSGISLEDSDTTVVIDPVNPDLGPGTYYHKFRVTWPDNSRQTLLKGTWTICEGE